jgi:hypothetical protein
MAKEVGTSLRRNILALSKATNQVTGEHSSLTLNAREKDADMWDKMREVLHKM